MRVNIHAKYLSGYGRYLRASVSIGTSRHPRIARPADLEIPHTIENRRGRGQYMLYGTSSCWVGPVPDDLVQHRCRTGLLKADNQIAHKLDYFVPSRVGGERLDGKMSGSRGLSGRGFIGSFAPHEIQLIRLFLSLQRLQKTQQEESLKAGYVPPVPSPSLFHRGSGAHVVDEIRVLPAGAFRRGFGGGFGLWRQLCGFLLRVGTLPGRRFHRLCSVPGSEESRSGRNR